MTNHFTPRQLAASALLFACATAASAQSNHARPYLLALRTSNGATTLTATSSSEGTSTYTLTSNADGTTTISGQPGVEPEQQTKDDLMDGLDRIGTNAKERNEVNLDKSMMALANHNNRYSDLSSKIELINIRNYEFANKGQYQKSDLDGLRRKLEGNGWSHLIRNESDSETNDIVVKSTGDGFISDMVIVNAEPREVNVVHIRGHFRMDDVNGAMGRVMGLSHGAGAGALGPLVGLGGNYSYSHSRTTTSTSSSPAPAAAPAPAPAPAAPAPPAH